MGSKTSAQQVRAQAVAAHERMVRMRTTELMNMSRFDMNWTVLVWFFFGLIFDVVFQVVEAKYYISRLTAVGIPMAIPENLRYINYNCWGVSEIVLLMVMSVRFLPWTLIIFDVGGGESEETEERVYIYFFTIASLVLNLCAYEYVKELGQPLGDSKWLGFLYWWRSYGSWLAIGVDIWAFLHICKQPIVNKKRHRIFLILGVVAAINVGRLWSGLPQCPH